MRHCHFRLDRRNYDACNILYDFLLTIKAVTLIFISARGSAILSAREGKLGSIYNLMKS